MVVMTQYILQEYGAWSVMVISYMAGILAAGKMSAGGAVSLIALALLINSKQAFTKWIRGHNALAPLIILIMQIFLASALLIAVSGADTVKLLPYLMLPAVYLLLFRFAGEHYFVTEICGFALLALSAPIAKFAVTGIVDNKLYLSTAIFFIAGVLRVRVQTRKGMLERISMVLYVLFAAALYHLIKTPLIVLLPLIDNLILSLTLYGVKLKTTGWIELSKGITFLVLMALV